MKRPLRAAVGVAFATTAALITLTEPATARYHETAPAEFEGRVIDLADADGWGPATACIAGHRVTRCFQTEAGLDVFLHAATGGPVGSRSRVPVADSCSTSLRLYSDPGYSGDVLYLSTLYLWRNLSVYGFDNRTSSYRVGACPATFADFANGGTPWYPGDTSAYSQAPSMVAGWDNRVSSVYLA